MWRISKKTSPLDRRLSELDQQISRLHRDLKLAGKTGSRPGRPAPVTPPADADREPDLFSHAGQPPVTPPNPPNRPGGVRRSTDSAPNRERFANYFTAGHFHNLRPAQQESRVVRNKAILMVVLALLLAFWLVYFFVLY